MKIHFSWTISTNKLMELETKIMVASTKGMDCHNTVWVQESEYNLVSPNLKKIAEILPYKPVSDFLEPWTTTPKWDVDPQGDVVVGTDADVMVWNQELVVQAAEKCLKNNCICGTIGYAAPFDILEWNTLFNRYNLPDAFNYRYTNTQEKSPYYINNGVVMMPSTMLPKFRESYKKWLIETNKWHHNLYYACQVATTLAIKDAQLPVQAMSRLFNYTEVDNPGTPLLADVIFLHYNRTRDELDSGIEKISNSAIKDRFLKMLPRGLKLL